MAFRSDVIWKHVVKPANLLPGASQSVSQSSSLPEVTAVDVYPAVASQLRAAYLAPQSDGRAADALHRYALSVSQRIDLSPPDADDAAAPTRDDFSAVVVINACPEPHDVRPATVRAPWDATVVTLDRTRQYDIVLYPGGLERFAGVYPGAVLGIHGTVLRRDPGTMRAAEIAVSRLVHPTIPKPLVGVAPSATAQAPGSARVHFAAGPFGYDLRRITTTLQKIVEVAKLRKAQLCVICGPFLPVPNPTNAESVIDAMPPVAEMVEMLSRLQQVAMREAPSMHLAFLPSTNDLSCIPVVPTTTPMLFPDNLSPLTVHFECSNPTEFELGGLKIGVCSYDALSQLAAVHLERGFTADTRVRQLCHSLVRSGLYVPNVTGHRTVDVTMLDKVALGAPSGGAVPHVLFYPNHLVSTPIAITVGGPGGVVLASCSNESDQALDAMTIMELYVADTAAAVTRGCTAENGVVLSTIQLLPTE